MKEPELDGCRACRVYSVGVESPLLRRWAHKCNYWGKDFPHVIRWVVEGERQPVDIPDWCPMPTEEGRFETTH